MSNPRPIDIKVRMLQAGLQGGEVAKALGISHGLLSNVLNGHRTGKAARSHLLKASRLVTKAEKKKEAR